MIKIWLISFGIILMQTSCTQHSAPIINKSPFRVIPMNYVIKDGDTLYSIAWKFGLDYQTIAHWNQLRSSDDLIEGKELTLYSNPKLKSLSKMSFSQSDEELVRMQKKTTLSTYNNGTQRVKETIVDLMSGPLNWIWPAQGAVINTFCPSKGLNGIQIAGQHGSSIVASESGQVIYVGEGIRGYGKLIIINHSENFLTTYAHNKTILVSEGERIKSGQIIAKMGKSGTVSPMLYFEIRQNGQPVNPMNYLN